MYSMISMGMLHKLNIKTKQAQLHVNCLIKMLTVLYRSANKCIQ
jgi:hypothetical protein